MEDFEKIVPKIEQYFEFFFQSMNSPLKNVFVYGSCDHRHEVISSWKLSNPSLKNLITLAYLSYSIALCNGRCCHLE